MSMHREPNSNPIANAWSDPVEGLSGRLRVEFEDLKLGLRYAVYAELRNQSFKPITVSNQPGISSELYDVSAKPVGTSASVRSGPIMEAQWVVIQRDVYIGFRVDMQTVG